MFGELFQVNLYFLRPVTPSFLGSNICLDILFSNTVNKQIRFKANHLFKKEINFSDRSGWAVCCVGLGRLVDAIVGQNPAYAMDVSSPFCAVVLIPHPSSPTNCRNES
jgi:hypothetical protein